MKILLLVIVIFLTMCSAYPNGGPGTEAICNSMTPGHGVAAQETESPFRILTSISSAIGGDLVDVEIQSDEGRFFKGFYLTARTNEEAFRVVGQFLESSGDETPFNLRDCLDGIQNTATHFNNTNKDKISFKWKAPENFEGQVHFR